MVGMTEGWVYDGGNPPHKWKILISGIGHTDGIFLISGMGCMYREYFLLEKNSCILDVEWCIIC